MGHFGLLCKNKEWNELIQARQNWLEPGLYLWKEWEVDRFENCVEVKLTRLIVGLDEETTDFWFV